jgi:hypothetical protein
MNSAFWHKEAGAMGSEPTGNTEVMSPKHNPLRSVIGNPALAAAIHDSVATALASGVAHLCPNTSVRAAIESALAVATRNINEHPRGKLFRRLIAHGR